MRTKLTRNLQIGLGLSLLLLIISSIASFVSIRNLITSSQLVDHSSQVVTRLESVMSTMKDAETGQRGFLITGQQKFLEPYNGAYDRAVHLVSEVQAMTMDNARQQANLEQIKDIILHRLNVLQTLLDKKMAGQAIDVEDMQAGKVSMDALRTAISKTEAEAKQVLAARLSTLQKFTTYTPLIIVFAALLAIAVSIFSYFKVTSEVATKTRLQQELEEKDANTSRRLELIQHVAGQISNGDYSIRVSQAEEAQMHDGAMDDLGGISQALNKMAAALEDSFNQLSESEWMQIGTAGLNDQMIGEKELSLLANDILQFIAGYTESQVGALYILSNETLQLDSSYALSSAKREITLGEGLVGQAALTNQVIWLRDVDNDLITVSHATGGIRPRHILVVPVRYQGSSKVLGVIELAAIHPYPKKMLDFVKSVAENIGIAINSAQNHKRLQELLEETQAQAEELQAQHSELENMNTELEAHAQKLQTSEEELRVQQEELQQTNLELEVRNRLTNELNLEIQQKAQALEQSTRYKSEFMANMSHELRTPLNSILLLSHYLFENSEKNLTEEQVESAGVILSSGNGLLSLIDELLDLSKIEAGKMELEYQQITIDGVISDLRSLFTPVAADKKLELVFENNLSDITQIETDRMRLEQILKNLLSNALKFTSTGEVKLEIRRWVEKRSQSQSSGQAGQVAQQRELEHLDRLDNVDSLDSIDSIDSIERSDKADASTQPSKLVTRDQQGQLDALGNLSNLSSSGSSDQILEFIVSDTGVGIPKDKQQLIFDAFQQADGSTKRKFGGTGLGLSISRELAQLLGGEIILVSDPGKGSVFTLRLPLDQAGRIGQHLGDKSLGQSFGADRPGGNQEVGYDYSSGAGSGYRNVSGSSAESASGSGSAATAQHSRFVVSTIPEEVPDDRNLLQKEGNQDKVVLIIEDDTAFAKALLNFTRKRGYKGIVAVRGDHGVSLAEAYRPVAILLDIQLPVMDGWQVMEALKGNSATRHIPVHIMSVMEAKKESRLKGAVDFISKPIAMEQMKEMFQKLEEVWSKHPKKVLIVEENRHHAQALANFLETFNVTSRVASSATQSVEALQSKEVDCVIMDMGIPDKNGYETLDMIKQNPGLENLPIIVFTGKHLSSGEESRIRRYADTIVVKTAHSYQRILDEVTLFLHLVEDQGQRGPDGSGGAAGTGGGTGGGTGFGARSASGATSGATSGGLSGSGNGRGNNYNSKLAFKNDVLQGKTVLIADDDVRNIFSMTKSLEMHGMQVVSATDGKEALEQLELHPEISVVLMDMMMPEMDGYESTRLIRQHPKLGQLPIIAVTAKAMLGDREKCIAAGASDYISKPVDSDQLISLLRVWLFNEKSWSK